MIAIQQGPNLALTIDDGRDIEPFIVVPLTMRRGKVGTDAFVESIGGGLSLDATESLFIEALGAGNYSRATGYYVEVWAFDRHNPDDEGILAETWAGDTVTRHHDRTGRTPLFVARESKPGEPEIDGEPISQHDVEVLALCAFYWQTVVGIEAVNVFLSDGGGSIGQGKATALLQMRGVLSVSPNSSKVATALSEQMATSSRTTDTARTSESVLLPAERAPRDRKPKTGKRARAQSA